MDTNTQINGQNSTHTQLVEVKVPVRTGMSNSMFVLWFVSIFVVVFISLSYFGLVPEGVREMNAVIFSTATTDQIKALSNNSVSGDPLETSSQMPITQVVSPEMKEQQVVIGSSVARPEGDGPSAIYSNAGKVLPTRLIISKIGLDTSISNPTSQKVSVLDQALLLGGVRYPASASLEEDGNMLLFGHSSGLKVVRNKAYRAFNDINKLAISDEIKVRSNSREYLYKVTKVLSVSADKQLVEFPVIGKTLTLSTCDTFGLKADRFVVEAVFVRSYLVVN